MSSEQRIAFLDGVSKDRFTIDERTSHRPPLRALARKNERELRRRFGMRAAHVHTEEAFSGREGVQLVFQFLARVRDNRQAMFVMRPADARGVADVLRITGIVWRRR